MELTKKARTRLLKLCSYMERLPNSANKHFSMDNYIDHQHDGHTHALKKHPKVADLHACGTSACALGWATTSPYFKKVGLHFDTFWATVRGDEAAFDVATDTQEWERIFGCRNNDKTPKAWAKRVRGLVKNSTLL
jgi:hypothetical protein